MRGELCNYNWLLSMYWDFSFYFNFLAVFARFQTVVTDKFYIGKTAMKLLTRLANISDVKTESFGSNKDQYDEKPETYP